MTGAEGPLAKEEQDLLDGVHRFAAEVMRPIGERLDRMTPEEVIAAGSPLWQVYTEFGKLGIGVDQLLAFEPAQAARAACLILEELMDDTRDQQRAKQEIAAGLVRNMGPDDA